MVQGTGARFGAQQMLPTVLAYERVLSVVRSLCQERVTAVTESFTQKWSDARLVERHDRNLRFQFGSTGGIQLETVFSFIEQHRTTLVRVTLEVVEPVQ